MTDRVDELREAIIAACQDRNRYGGLNLELRIIERLLALRPKTEAPGVQHVGVSNRVLGAEDIPQHPGWQRLLRRLTKAEAERDRLAATIAATECVIADRGVTEKDCTAPLPQRVDALIVEQRSAQHLAAENARLDAANTAQATRLAHLHGFEGEIRDIAAERDALARRVDPLEATIKRLYEERDRLKAEAAKLQAALISVRDEVAQSIRELIL